MEESDYFFKKQTEAKLFYSKLKEITCPGLGHEIISFTAIGMRHLIRKGALVRSTKDQIRRFYLLKYIVPILCNPHPIVVHRQEKVREIINRHGQKIIIETTADFWSFSEVRKNRLITVVVRQLQNGRKHFFSVMSGKNKFKKFPRNLKIPRMGGSLKCLLSASMPIETDVSQAHPYYTRSLKKYNLGRCKNVILF